MLLTRTASDPPKPPLRGILRPRSKAAAESAEAAEEPKGGLRPPKGKETSKPGDKPETLTRDSNEQFHAFTWLEHVRLFSADLFAKVDDEELRNQLQEVDDYLQNGTSFSDKKTYQSGKEATRLSSLEYLEQQASQVDKGKNKIQKKQEYEDRIDILNAADVVFRFFLPAVYEGPTVQKYWGAIRDLVEVG